MHEILARSTLLIVIFMSNMTISSIIQSLSRLSIAVWCCSSSWKLSSKLGHLVRRFSFVHRSLMFSKLSLHWSVSYVRYSSLLKISSLECFNRFYKLSIWAYTEPQSFLLSKDYFERKNLTRLSRSLGNSIHEDINYHFSLSGNRSKLAVCYLSID